MIFAACPNLSWFLPCRDFSRFLVLVLISWFWLFVLTPGNYLPWTNNRPLCSNSCSISCGIAFTCQTTFQTTEHSEAIRAAFPVALLSHARRHFKPPTALRHFVEISGSIACTCQRAFQTTDFSAAPRAAFSAALLSDTSNGNLSQRKLEQKATEPKATEMAVVIGCDLVRLRAPAIYW